MVTREVSNRASNHSQRRNRAPEERAQLHLRLQYTVAQILADARSEHEACAAILSTICENLGWQWGAFWIRRGAELRLLACWHNSECVAQEFDQISHACAFSEGEGMPGRVWAERKAVWIDDFSEDPAMPRRVSAARCNLHSAIGIPIIGQEVLGVIELFNTEVLPADPELLKMVAATGAQIGQFLQRKRAEQALNESQGQRERSARILAAAGAILGEGLDLQATVHRVARVAIPEFADWCALDLVDEEGKIERAAIAHADPKIEERAQEFARRIRIDPNRPFGSPRVIRTGQTEFVEVTPEILRQVAGDEFFALVQRLNLSTAVVSPLKRLGRTFGALSFWRTKARGPFSPGDAELAEELARRAGWTLDNARLYEAAKQELQLREKAEAELKHLNADLEKRIEERTSELRESNSQLESFCYSVSHDLRAPLRSMQGFSHALIEDHADKLDPEGQDFARRILSAAEHMDKLLADVLTYSRLTRQELKLEPVNADEVIEEARLQLQNEIKNKGAEVDIAACARKVVANRSVLELMITNLLDNALKFVPSERTPKISVHCERHGERYRIWVRDNGIGIAREHQQKIFRIFERLHGVEAYPGTGVGLALVQKAAERMNGAVGVESTLGEGSAFWIELPCARTENSP